MPLNDDFLIAFKDGTVELTATVTDPHRDDVAQFTDAVRSRVFDHQYQAMTDPTIIDPVNVAVATCLISREPLPDPLRDGLISLGFAPVETEGGGREERSLFSRFGRGKRAKLDKWRSLYLRAGDISEKLNDLEECLADEMPSGALEEISEEGSQVLVNAARTCLRLLLSPGLESLGQLERQILSERGQRKGRLVLYPSAVKALACFTSESIRTEAPDSTWSSDPDDESVLCIATDGGAEVTTDPEFRVVKFVTRGNKEMLTSYIESVISQSQTTSH